MSVIITLLILVILVALIFEYINGFHDFGKFNSNSRRNESA